MVWETVAPLVDWCRRMLLRLLGGAAPHAAMPLLAEEPDDFNGGEDGRLTDSDYRYPSA